MSKLKKDFQFTYQKKVKGTFNLRACTRIAFNLTISGVAYFDPIVSALDMEDSRYEVDIDFVQHDGHDIREVVEYAPELWADIEESAVRHAATLFESEKEVHHESL